MGQYEATVASFVRSEAGAGATAMSQCANSRARWQNAIDCMQAVVQLRPAILKGLWLSEGCGGSTYPERASQQADCRVLFALYCQVMISL